MKITFHQLFFAAFIFCCCACKQPEANKKQSPDPVIKNQGVKIAYTDTHTGDTTLLFVHGWCINKGYWLNQVSFFKNRYRVVTMDLPGFGESGKNRETWNTAAFGKDVTEVIKQLGLKNVILIGHSMAGDIIVQAANNVPKEVIGLVGVDNFKSVGVGGTPSRQDSIAYQKAIDSLKHDFKRIAFEYFNHDLFSKTTSAAIKARILNDVAHSDSTIAAACMEQDNFSESAELLKAKKKLNLINSDVTPTNTTGMKAKGIPFQIWYIHGSGHFPMVEHPSEFNNSLFQAIQKLNT
ncbi:alpha/beta fold hydrolase [Mucilaginibacter aquaedulcis]|uniref:alpha/beta fold hydrolase n=1 Tax=Mucilaginibacter aquaedulcis TaxID=1187081 RepID=UPI0025B42DE0|nr:alpha/beta hydrolase [Mucilaginibacter aquaedulcis]MDN3550428.1 alpha/beta hydrolase [Mucilaginibacter aquaedulcis]